MANILINVQGLLEGKRLRKLGLKARLYYPLLLGMANTFARLELDYDLLAARFITFHDPDTANIAEWFKEYEQAKLVFIYDGHDAGAEEPTRWAQFDTPVELRRSFATKEDNDSPEPPEPAYSDWLKSIHGAEWEQFHLSNYQKERRSDISGKRAAAGRKGAEATNAKRWGADSESQQNRQYNWNCKAFCGNCERNIKFMEATKKTSKWKPVLERYASIVTMGNLPPEEPSPDNLCATCGEPWITCPCNDDLV